jgi:hypothetical protein
MKDGRGLDLLRGKVYVPRSCGRLPRLHRPSGTLSVLPFGSDAGGSVMSPITTTYKAEIRECREATRS